MKFEERHSMQRGNLKEFSKILCALSVVASYPVFAQSSTPPKLYTVSPTGVNLEEGAYTYSNTDLVIGPLKLERSHLGGKETAEQSNVFRLFS